MAENNTDLNERKKKIQDDKDYTSNRISDLARYMGFGVVAVIFALLTGTSPIGKKLESDLKWLTLLAVMFGIATIFFDYFHYLFGYQASKNASGGDRPSYRYDKKWWSYKMRLYCFWGKQITAITSGLLLVVAVAWALIG